MPKGRYRLLHLDRLDRCFAACLRLLFLLDLRAARLGPRVVRICAPHFLNVRTFFVVSENFSLSCDEHGATGIGLLTWIVVEQSQAAITASPNAGG